MSGETKKPAKENAHKFELFLHNFLPFCNKGKFGVMCVERAKEFAPVKNADEPGKKVSDSPSEARELLFNLHRSWILKHGELDQDLSNQIGERQIELDILHSF